MPILSGEITRLLEKWSGGDDAALSEVMALVYSDLRRLAAHYMHGERSDHTLQATALVHEAYLKVKSLRQSSFQSRQQFIGAFIGEMRRVLIDHARKHSADKRGGGIPEGNIDELALPSDDLSMHDLMTVDEALKKLAMLNEQQCKIFDARFFGGLTIDETASYLGISKATVERGYAVAKAFLSHELDVSETT